MEKQPDQNIEELFFSLPKNEKKAIISRGSALYSSFLKKQLFLAQAKVRQLQEKYQIPMKRLDEEGLPDTADFQMHEDFLMWHHWSDKVIKLEKQIAGLEKITRFGLFSNSEEMDDSD